MDTLSAVAQLLKTYEHALELPVQYRPGSWSESGNPDYFLLTDPSLTVQAGSDSRDRLVRSETLENVAGRAPTDDVESLRRLFVLVMAWGSGTSNPRSYRYTRAALADSRLDTALKTTAEACRHQEISGLREAYSKWKIDGVQRSFFTKWFRFAGHTPERSWQPLILDDRVLRTLNKTFGMSTREIAASRQWADRYTAYVRLAHEWANALDGVTAQRIEWVMFMHNGRDLSDTSTRR